MARNKGVPKHRTRGVSTNAFKAPFVVAAETMSAAITQIGIEAANLANMVLTARLESGTAVVDRYEPTLKDFYADCSTAVSTLHGKWSLPDMYVGRVCTRARVHPAVACRCC